MKPKTWNNSEQSIYEMILETAQKVRETCGTLPEPIIPEDLIRAAAKKSSETFRCPPLEKMIFFQCPECGVDFDDTWLRTTGCATCDIMKRIML